MNESKTMAILLMVAVINAVAVGSATAASMTSTTAYTYFKYEEQSLLKRVFVYWEGDAEITSLDTEDRYKIFYVAMRGEFHTNTSCTSLSHSRPACKDKKIGTLEDPLRVSDDLDVKDRWFVGICQPDEGYQSYATSYIYGASNPVTDTDCKAANCD